MGALLEIWLDEQWLQFCNFEFLRMYLHLCVLIRSELVK